MCPVSPSPVEADETEAARWLRASFRALVRRFSVSERADVSCCGVTVAQAAAVETLKVEGPMRMGALCRRLGITPSTLTRNLRRLESAGLVSRVRDAADARANRVGLTAQGRKAAERLEQQEEAFAADILSRLPLERRRRALEGLSDLLGALREATEACCPGAFDHLMTLPAAEPARVGCQCEVRDV